MNSPLNLFHAKRFIFPLALLVATTSLTEAIPCQNADLREPRCSRTRAIRGASEPEFVSYSKTLSSGGDPFQSARA
jgi:hypothetical protein